MKLQLFSEWVTKNRSFVGSSVYYYYSCRVNRKPERMISHVCHKLNFQEQTNRWVDGVVMFAGTLLANIDSSVSEDVVTVVVIVS